MRIYTKHVHHNIKTSGIKFRCKKRVGEKLYKVYFLLCQVADRKAVSFTGLNAN